MVELILPFQYNLPPNVVEAEVGALVFLGVSHKVVLLEHKDVLLEEDLLGEDEAVAVAEVIQHYKLKHPSSPCGNGMMVLSLTHQSILLKMKDIQVVQCLS